MGVIKSGVKKKWGVKKKRFFLIKKMGIPLNRIKKEFFLKNLKFHHMSSQMKLKEIPLLFHVSNRTNRQTHKHTNRQTDKQTNRQTDKLLGSIVCRNIGHSSEWQKPREPVSDSRQRRA